MQWMDYRKNEILLVGGLPGAIAFQICVLMFCPKADLQRCWVKIRAQVLSRRYPLISKKLGVKALAIILREKERVSFAWNW